MAAGHFFRGFFAWIFCFCIFFRKWANFVAGLRGVWRSFLDMAAPPFPNSTGPGVRTVESTIR
jgi:hypothetical protein